MKHPVKKDRNGIVELPYKITHRPALKVAIGHVMLVAILVMMISQVIVEIRAKNIEHLWETPLLFVVASLFIGFLWYFDGLVTRIQFDEEKLTITMRFGGLYRIKKIFYKKDRFKINGREDKRPELVRLLLRDSPQPNRYILEIEKSLFNRYPMICDSNKGSKIIKTLRKWKNN